MTLDETIKYVEKEADEHERRVEAKAYTTYDLTCANRNRRLADWLKELKQLREQTRWTPVSERLPKKKMNCLVTDSLGKVHKVTFYHALDGRGSYFSGCYVVRAWMPLPEPYREDGETE